ncbi:MAG: prepilin-type N-terminal cleavage/methylation domain-containing protein [Nitrospirota bacterium]|nr:prepilin-type N-terminal cleavage/methylation domain-containing protein [Nitrospirota bacterium]
MKRYLVETEGVTLIELVVVVAIMGIVILALVAPEIGRFGSNYNVRSCATDLIQNMRVARAMAIKENREYLIVFQPAGTPDSTVNPQGRYLIGFDFDGDNDLTTISATNDGDTFGVCKDTDSDRLPNNDADANSDGVPDCVRVVNLSDCGTEIIFGYSSGTTPPIGPNGTSIPVSGITFSGTPPTAEFDPDGSTDKLGSVYFQQTGRGFSYCVRISNLSGTTNMWKWDGDKDNTSETNWTEIR